MAAPPVPDDPPEPDEPAAARIDRRIAELADWRGARLAALRAVIVGAQAGVLEEWKWGVPVWSCAGILCTGEVYQQVVKLTFAHGAALPDPAGLFNASLEGRVRRAIDVRQGDAVDASALAELVRAAIARNQAAPARAARPRSATRATRAKAGG